MKVISFLRSHHDVALALLIIIAGIADSLVLGYSAPNLAGSIPGAVLMGAGLAMLMTFPFFLYLAGKYGSRGMHAHSHHAA